MSSNEDGDAFKKKYAEIAALKKALEEKKQAEKQARGSRTRYINNYVPVRSAPIQKKWQNKQAKSMRSSFSNVTAVFTKDDKNTVSNDVSQGYVSKTSKGSMSLVNTAVYQRQQQQYHKILQEKEELKKLKESQRSQQLLQKNVSRNKVRADNCDRIKIEGVPYAVTKMGNRLLPLGIPNSEFMLKKQIVWANKVYSIKNGASLKCVSGKTRKSPTELCRYFSRTGICQKGSKCKYSHDRSKIRICNQFMVENCWNKNCLLSHNSTEFNTPLCKYFLENKCFNPNCKFQHIKPPRYDEPHTEIWICRPFAIGGWCVRGNKCPFLHLFNCPDFEEQGFCLRNKSCDLAHPVTKRIQRLMSNSESFDNDNSVEVGPDDTEENEEEEIISSYTVDPELLLSYSSLNGKYDIYIDKQGAPTATPNQQFMIILSDSESDSSEDEDSGDIEENSDFVHI
ncbi:uncharacterized protein RJT21DRAFT_121472 [Scheffersomyces amazonensis]|uniref:uncharacterized protein n=1 Tax=Scheffersomyces amazonensis TaxID=1078765 RepID=UPI00315C7C11